MEVGSGGTIGETLGCQSDLWVTHGFGSVRSNAMRLMDIFFFQFGKK